MPIIQVLPPFPIFTELDGQPLEDGYIYVGEPNLDPQVNPKAIYWDSNLSLPAGQPVRTLGGYPVNTGTPAKFYVNGDYSIRVLNKNGAALYSSPSVFVPGSDRVIDITKLGAGQGGADDSAIIQSAVDLLVTLGGGTIYFPPATYNFQNEVVPKSGVNYRGEGKNSSLVWNSLLGGYFFNQASTDLENVTWDGIGFDGTINYITDPTIYKQTYTRRNTPIRTAGVAAKNVTVRNCYFENISNGSIDFNGDFSDGIFVLNNTFINGCYCFKVVAVRTPSGSPVSDAGRPQNILFDGNYLSGGGPTGFYDASKEAWTASTDGLDVDSCKDVIISNNTVVGIASIGIRVEQTLRAKVIGNTVKETGNTGITFYNDCFDGVCVGNTVENWGRIPPAYAIRSFGGVYYAAQEFPDPALAPLPADPSVSAWFYVWPYALTGVNASTIIPYANTQYYPAVNGINPFRGDAAIAITQGSQKINVVGNNIVGNITTSGGLYNYASDYGITCITPGNAPGGQTFAPLNSMITGNGVTDARVYRIWHPQFGDPIHYNTASYNTGDAVYAANRDSSSLIWSGNIRFAQDGQLIANVSSGSSGRSNFQANWINFPSTQVASADANTLDDYEEGTFAPSLIASTSGTVTLDFTTLAYTKVGRVVTITGEIQVGSVSSPVGDITLENLPFPNSGLAQRASKIGMFIEAAGLIGPPTGIIQGALDANASVVQMKIVNNFAFTALSASLQIGSIFKFCFSYTTTT
jgi:hypothetical protein